MIFVFGVFFFVGNLSRHGSSQKDEVATLQSTIASLDREKDALQDAVDQKTESVVLLQEEIHRKVLVSFRKSENCWGTALLR